MRCGYFDDVEDNWALIKYRGQVASAIRGRRGQKLLREALAALDAMPEKRLIDEELVNHEGDVCLLGAVGRRIGVADLDKIDPAEHDVLASRFDVAEPLIREVEYVNDEGGPFGRRETPEERWLRVRDWLVKQIAVVSEAGRTGGEEQL